MAYMTKQIRQLIDDFHDSHEDHSYAEWKLSRKPLTIEEREHWQEALDYTEDHCLSIISELEALGFTVDQFEKWGIDW